jgi:hypothetical protein
MSPINSIVEGKEPIKIGNKERKGRKVCKTA